MARNGSWLLRSYNFKGRDPECDRLQTLYQKQHIKEDDLAALSGVSTSTVKNLFNGTTQQPRFSTLMKLAKSMGKTYVLSGDLRPNYEAEIPLAKAERKEYWQHLKEKRERAARKSK